MLASKVQTPTFLYERALDLLVDRFPPAAMERLRANLAAFRAWIAAPAYRKKSAKAAVEYILNSAGPAVQLKVEFITLLGEVPDGFALLAEVVTDELDDVTPQEHDPVLAEAVGHLQAAQRIWLRFVTFHPDLEGVEGAIGAERLAEVISLGFHTDNLLTVCLMGADGSCGAVRPQVQHALAAAAGDFAERYHTAVRGVVELAAPTFDAARPFRTTTLQDLLALPPYEGPAAKAAEMGESVAAMFAR